LPSSKASQLSNATRQLLYSLTTTVISAMCTRKNPRMLRTQQETRLISGPKEAEWASTSDGLRNMQGLSLLCCPSLPDSPLRNFMSSLIPLFRQCARVLAANRRHHSGRPSADSHSKGHAEEGTSDPSIRSCSSNSCTRSQAR
jgi:hypothetical protein